MDHSKLDELKSEIVATWRRHNEILVFLLENIPDEGLTAKPTASRGRDVAAQFYHLQRVRLGWLHHHATGERPKIERLDKDAPPSKKQLLTMLAESGAGVEKWLELSIEGKARIRMFGKQPLRWMGYLIAHESHHRGQIALALKQSGLRLPEKVAMQGLWGKWIYGS